jgi:thioredoxin 1
MNESETLDPAKPALPPETKKGFNFWRFFWLSFLVVSLAYAWYCFYVPSNRVAWAANYNDAQQQAARDGKPMILFFTSTWCVPCRIMKRNVWADEQVTVAVNAAFIPVAIYVDDPNSAEVVRRYGVGFTPKTIVTDSQGTVLQQTDGGIGKAEFLEMLDQRKLFAGKDD